MADKFQNKYRIPSARLKGWDYGSGAAYFVTIVTKNRERFFGEMVKSFEKDGSVTVQKWVMSLSEIGKIVQNEWLKTPALRPGMNLELGAFVVMPDHFHGIVVIGENAFNGRDARRGVSTTPSTQCVASFGPQSNNLASIIRGFKSSVTVQARQLQPAFEWQPRFYDHIIRDETAFEHISRYIANNPGNWMNGGPNR